MSEPLPEAEAPAEPIVAGPASRVDVRPRVTLTLLSLQHALLHAQTALLPLVFIPVIARYGVGVEGVGYLVAIGNLLSGAIQVVYGPLGRVISRRAILGAGGLVFGAGMSAAALATSWLTFGVTTVVARVGGSPQHPVGNALLAEQYPANRRASAISVHIAIGNLGTVAVPLAGGWLIATQGWEVSLVAVGVPAIVVAFLILVFVRETGADRALALEEGSTMAAFRKLAGEPNLLWLFAASSVAAAGRGIGIVTTFVPLYLARVLDLDTTTVALMYTLLLVGSVPGPLVAGWLSDRVGHKPVLVGSYLLGAGALFTFVAAGSTLPLVWLALGFMSAFVFEESALLQALLADVTRPAIRDVAFSAYFTLMFVVGAAWAALIGALIGALGDAAGFPVAFTVMSASFLAAAVVVLPIRAHRPSAASGQSFENGG